MSLGIKDSWDTEKLKIFGAQEKRSFSKCIKNQSDFQ